MIPDRVGYGTLLAPASPLRRCAEWLVSPSRDESPEIRDALLNSIPENTLSLVASLAAVAVAAVGIYTALGPAWVAGMVGVPCSTLLTRLVLQRSFRHGADPGRSVTLAGVIATNLAMSLSISWAACQSILIGNQMLALMAGIAVLGCSGVVISRFAATPRLAVAIVSVLLVPICLVCFLRRPDLMVAGIMVIPSYFLHVNEVFLNHAVLVAMLRAQERNRFLSVTDPLTGLPNRADLNARLHQLCRELDREPAPAHGFALLSLDLDGFKAVNDSLGHQAGDQVLRAVAQVLKSCVRRQDTVGRMGGDEFLILLPGADHASTAAIAARLVEAVSQPLDGILAGLTVGASIGIVLAPVHGTEYADLVARADRALYSAKRAGRGRYLFHEDEAAAV